MYMCEYVCPDAYSSTCQMGDVGTVNSMEVVTDLEQSALPCWALFFVCIFAKDTCMGVKKSQKDSKMLSKWIRFVG